MDFGFSYSAVSNDSAAGRQTGIATADFRLVMGFASWLAAVLIVPSMANAQTSSSEGTAKGVALAIVSTEACGTDKALVSKMRAALAMEGSKYAEPDVEKSAAEFRAMVAKDKVLFCKSVEPIMAEFAKLSVDSPDAKKAAAVNSDFEPTPGMPAKFVSAADLAAETHKWDDRVIETRMSCFYADKEEFRCIGGGARIDVRRILPAAAQQRIEDRCDTISKSNGKACNLTFKFVYSGFSRMESGNGLLRRITYIAAKGATAFDAR